MPFLDKPRVIKPEVPERYLEIGNGFHLNIGSGFRLIIQDFRRRNQWDDKRKAS